MSIHKSYAVFGLGRYGRAVARELIDNGAEVIAVDSNSKIVEDLVGEFPICKCADITDYEVIKQLGISNVDTVVIAIASDFESGVMATMLCKEAGVGQVIVKCSSEIHRTILEKVGADIVVFPENDSGIRLAKNILSSGFIDIADISEDISIIEISARGEWIGKSLAELELRKKHSINVVAINQQGNTEIDIRPDTVIEEDMKMIVIASKKEIDKLK
ncbi:MAG: TrkA family potassium uptake protein [Ruminococcaceae bacterium]|nr:TrkA family potassium uptake protein [Oscillospiraceae bacterium]